MLIESQDRQRRLLETRYDDGGRCESGWNPTSSSEEGGVSVRVGYPGIFSSYGRVSRITATARKALPVRGPRCRLPLREDEKYIYLPQSTEISPWPRGAKMFDAPSGSNDGSKEGKELPSHGGVSSLHPPSIICPTAIKARTPTCRTWVNRMTAKQMGWVLSRIPPRTSGNEHSHTEDETADAINRSSSQAQLNFA